VRKLNKQTLKAIAYSQNALSFIFLDFSINDSIKRVYLYGSAVRGELDKNSDIDIFIDCDSGKEKAIEGLARAAFSRFYHSKDFDKWKIFKFSYPFSVHAGKLEEWQLKNSIMSEGILMYSNRTGMINAERQVIFIYKLPRKKKDYLHFVRGLFGRKEKGYNDNGLLGEVRGLKISGNAFIIPRESLQKITSFMQKEKIDYSMKEISLFR